MATYRTKDGDMLDQICLSFYGQAQGSTEQVLDRNPRLADLGPLLPAGIVVELPETTEISIETQQQQIRLWD